MTEQEWAAHNEECLLHMYEKIRYYSESMGLFLFNKSTFTFPVFVKFAAQYSTKEHSKYLPNPSKDNLEALEPQDHLDRGDSVESGDPQEPLPPQHLKQQRAKAFPCSIRH